MNVLFIGDIVGKPGREAIRKYLPELRDEYKLDCVIANAENASGGRGLTKDVAREIYQHGVDVITMGNHVWDQREIIHFIDEDNKLVRPANYPRGVPGKGFLVCSKNKIKIGVINLAGRVFMTPLENPFTMIISLVNKIREETPIILVDFHAEATSEKVAMGWFLDGKVSAVLGTHTHIQTADARILDNGTGYITDAGMTGPRNSVLGVKKEIIINNFLTQMPARFDVADGAVQINGVFLEIDSQTGKAKKILPLQRY
ncbi:TIGR00282 family metallophosphoesterase [Syntrophobotulus glycolicus]|uniref:TIGR00282 family metallophosphoesterase n=1 Tax=Syntrophobotulus glycolicus TaxID=51197 RepID=UPI0002F132D1|nr:TIGR00282 family metallophosphoesterase [Syntrophobotulus glycolicus]